MKKIISLADIDIINSPKVRAEFSPEIAEEYADQYRLKKNSMPLPVLFQIPLMIGHAYFIGDGLHRITGMKLAGLKEHVFEIMTGKPQDCIRYALGSNVGHGIRRTNADKRHCVTVALQEFKGVSNGVIADYCAVGVDLVADVLKGLTAAGTVAPVDKKIGLDGKARTVNPRLTTVETPETKENSEETEVVDTVPSAPVVPSADGEIKDETGIAIPAKAMAVWGRRHEIDPFLDTIEDLKRDIEAAAEAKDLLFAEVNFKSLIADAANIRGQLLLAKPYAVCPSCQSKLPEYCKLCLGKGVVSKFRFETCPEELRKMRGMK